MSGGCVVCGSEEASPTVQFVIKHHSGDKTTVSFRPLVLPSMLLTVLLTAVCEFTSDE